MTLSRASFNALTPGRQRGNIFYSSQPKLSKTREARIEKSTPLVLAGEGLNDWRSRKSEQNQTSRQLFWILPSKEKGKISCCFPKGRVSSFLLET